MVGRAETTINGRKATARAPRKAKQPGAAKPTLAARLRQAEAERDEALAQQAATAEILQIINRSAGDATPVFDAIVERAMRLCDAPFGGLLVPDGEYLRYLALGNAPQRFAAFLMHERIRLSTMLGPGVLAGETLHIVDLPKEDSYRRRIPVTVSAVEEGGIRSLICVPLIKDGAFIGAFTLYRQEVRPFTDRQIALARSFADQAAIAMENARLMTETREALDRQTATAEILQLINASPGDLAPVFKAMLDKALRLCEASLGALYFYDGGTFRMAAESGASAEAIEALRTVVPEPGSGMAQIVEGANVVQVADAADTDAYRSGVESRRKFVELTGGRTALWIALRKDNALLGILIIYRREVRPFSDKHIALLQNFADQAVIAMENARLMAETREALEKQTATAEILRVISGSPTHLQPTLDAIAARAKLLSDGADGHVFTYDGTLIHHRAQYGATEAGLAAIRTVFPAAPSRGSSICRAIMTREISHVVDPKLDPEFAHLGLAEYGTALSVPMLRDGKALGGISVIRQRVEPFTPAQIDLLKTFADQAVIAIENVRLFTELRERTSDLQQSLEYQTAISDVLKVISRSTFDLQPVLDTLVETAGRLCNSDAGGLTVRDGDVFRYTAFYGFSDEARDVLRQRPLVPGRDTVAGRTALEGKIVHVADLAADSDFAWNHALNVSGTRSIVGVPMLRDGEVIGTFGLTRNRVEPFTERQIELLRTFADQAVIAIENARLLSELQARTNDLQESLEYQTAISDVLKVISRSTFDLQPVLDTLMQTVARLCPHDNGALAIRDGDVLRWRAFFGGTDEVAALLRRTPVTPGRGSIPGRTALEGKVVHILDIAADSDYAIPEVIAEGVRTALGVPLLRDGVVAGVFTLTRNRIEPFTERQIELVRTFADQAVIAIENARLLSELRESLDRQTATAEILRAIASTPGDPTRALDTIAETAARMFGAANVGIRRLDGGMLHYVASAGRTTGAMRDQALARSIDSPDFFARAARENRQFHLPDFQAEIAKWPAELQETLRRGGVRTAAFTPLTRDGKAIGAMGVNRTELRPFRPDELELMKGFADQAVIAIENARLLTELRTRTNDLQESLEYQTATSDVLKVISRSTFDLQPVLDTLIRTAGRLCIADGGGLSLREGERFRFLASIDDDELSRAMMRQTFVLGRETLAGRVMLEGKVIHVADARENVESHHPAQASFGELRTALGVPLLRDGTVVGAFSLARNRVEPFTERQIELMRTFADQAVIAIENARLLTELRESLDRQTATANVLGVISASPGELAPVFDTILEDAMHLCEAATGHVWQVEGENLRIVAARVPAGEDTPAVTASLPELGGVPLAEAIGRKASVLVDDYREHPSYRARHSGSIAMVEQLGARTALLVPMMKDDDVLGVITLYRREVRPFTQKHLDLVQGFAAQAVIAIENARLLSELRESLEYQTATSDVLSVINSSPGDLAPVFDAILDKAVTMAASHGALFLFDGVTTFRAAAVRGYPDDIAQALRQGVTLSDAPAFRPLVEGARLFHQPDLLKTIPEDDAVGRYLVERSGIRTNLMLPLRKDKVLLGVIACNRHEVRPFADKEIALLENFAAQAVIAIENARLLTELRESLDRQTATADILRAIASTPDDPTRALDTIAETAARMFDGANVGIRRLEGEMLRMVAVAGPTNREISEIAPERPLDSEDEFARAVRENRQFHVPDALGALDRWPPAFQETIRRASVRTTAFTPLNRDGKAIGAMVVNRTEVRPFRPDELELMKGFADQAVIAIENARLLTELRESLEQQQAIAEVLQVINASPGNLTPVYDVILEKAHSLCDAAYGSMQLWDGNELHYVAVSGQSAFTLGRRSLDGPNDLPRRLIAGESVVHIADIRDVDDAVTRRAAAAGTRSAVLVPLRKEGTLLGIIVAARHEIRPFTDKQIALLQSFAAQAVIAIENARLLTELRESLEQQQAIAEVLQVINASPGNLQPVFDSILDKAHGLCGANVGWLLTFDGEFVRVAAARGLADLDPSVASTPFLPGPAMRRLIEGESFFQIPAISEVKDMPGTPLIWRASCELLGEGNYLVVPLRKDGTVHGFINAFRSPIRLFSEKEVSLLQSFAAQAVIAMDNARLLTELRESLEQQQAIAEVLQVINASPGNLAPVYDVILEKAHTLCGTTEGSLQLWDGEELHVVAAHGSLSTAGQEVWNRERALRRRLSGPNDLTHRLIAGESVVHVANIRDVDDPTARLAADAGLRTVVVVPLRKEGALVGFIAATRREVRPFTDKQIALLQSFAAQAVIAMDNARLLTELRESLEQQQAIAEVLQVINASPGNLAPVYDAILEKAHNLCGAAYGNMQLWDGEEFRVVAARGQTLFVLGHRHRIGGPNDLTRRLLAGENYVQVADSREVDDPTAQRAAAAGARTVVLIPLRREGTLLGYIAANRREVQPFTDKEIALLESFAAQAVIAMDNARLLGEIRQRQAELRVTFENMGDAVIMFDGAQRLVAWNRNFQTMLDIPEEWLATPRTYNEYADYLTERGEFGDTPPPDLGAPETGEVRPIRYERTRPDGRILEVRRNPIPGGAGFVFIYSDITERKLAEQSILAAREAAEKALTDLKLAQANLIQAEKMASLGALTAGIAHEIKNPLNFVNNFANLSNELLGELKETAAPAFATLDSDTRDEIDETMDMLSGNLEKIQEHGKRADGIVKSMLAHSRGGSGDRREADVNALVEESLNLAYHGARAQDQNFNITLERDYDKAMKPIELVPQDITRVFLNLCGNGFYAANKRRTEGDDEAFRPVLKVATRELGDAVEVRIRDNGTGIPPEVKDKLFQPFFTTKPTGEGTGLGLSISYDIVTQQHGGTIAVESAVGDFTEFTIHLPRKR